MHAYVRVCVVVCMRHAVIEANTVSNDDIFLLSLLLDAKDKTHCTFKVADFGFARQMQQLVRSQKPEARTVRSNPYPTSIQTVSNPYRS